MIGADLFVGGKWFWKMGWVGNFSRRFFLEIFLGLGYFLVADFFWRFFLELRDFLAADFCRFSQIGGVGGFGNS